MILYNRDRVMFHLWIAYVQLIVNNAFPGLTVDQAFTKSTDGPAALAEPKLADEHRQFISELESGERGCPTWRGKLAGIGGVCTTKKTSS